MDQDPYTVSRRRLPPILRVADSATSIALELAPWLAPVDPDALMEAAERKTGLDDWGPMEFRERLARILEDTESRELSAMGRLSVSSFVSKALTTRLQQRAYFAAHPEAADRPIQRPLFILGFPRSGTTLLQNLLALSPDRRALEFWELTNPVPLPEDFEAYRSRSLRSVNAVLGFAYTVAPEMGAVHEVGATTAEECWPLFATTFSVLNWDLASGMRGYGDFLLGEDMEGAYRDYKRNLQMLQHGRPPQDYLLKCPEHLWFLDALLTVFPDAGIVWTHRDPTASIASYCSLVSMGRRMTYGSFDPTELGSHITERFQGGVERAMAARDRWGEDRFFDVDFTELVADPGQKVREIREWFGIPHPPGGDEAMEAWLTNDRSDKRGKHIYSHEFYGVDPQDVGRRYRDYVERFSISTRA